MADQVVSPDTAATLHQEAEFCGASPTWIVMKVEFGPEKLIARLVVVERPTDYVLTANTLTEMYAKLPWGLTHSDRRPRDPPEVIEVWSTRVIVPDECPAAFSRSATARRA
jgi:hypothetical protein